MVKWAVWDAKKTGIFISFDTEYEASQYFNRVIKPHIDNPKNVFYGATVGEWRFESTHERLLRLTRELVRVQGLICHSTLDRVVTEMKEITHWDDTEQEV